MRNLITLVFVISTNQAFAKAICQAGTKPSCEQALAAADKVISKQDELLLLQKNRLDVLQDENEKLSQVVVDMSRLNDKSNYIAFTYGAAGAALGILLTVIVTK